MMHAIQARPCPQSHRAANRLPILAALSMAGSIVLALQQNSSMANIPGGEFIMSKSHPNERPVHRTYVDPFWMDPQVPHPELRYFAKITSYTTPADPRPARNTRHPSIALNEGNQTTPEFKHRQGKRAE